MEDKINPIKEDALRAVQAAQTLADLENVRIHYLGKKSALQELLKSLGYAPTTERPRLGALVNDAKVSEFKDKIGEKNFWK